MYRAQTLTVPQSYPSYSEPIIIEIGTPFTDYSKKERANADEELLHGVNYEVTTGRANFRLSPFEDPGAHVTEAVMGTLQDQGATIYYVWLKIEEGAHGPVDGGYPEWIEWWVTCKMQFKAGHPIAVIALIALIAVLIGLNILVWQVGMIVYRLIPVPLDHFTCEICGQTCFPDTASLDAHRREIHGVVAYTCPYCNLVFPTIEALSEHIKTVHGSWVTAIPWITILGVAVTLGVIYLASRFIKT